MGTAISLQDRGCGILSVIQERHPGYHPLIAIADMAHDDSIEDNLKFQCHKELAKYIAPSLKATEIHQSSSDLPTVRVVMFNQNEMPVEDAEIV